MSDEILNAASEWIGSVNKGLYGALFNESLTFGQDNAAKAESLYAVALTAEMAGDKAKATNALMTASQLHLTSADYYLRASSYGTIERTQLLALSQEQNALAQKAIEAVHLLENTPAESTTDAGLDGVTVDEADTYPIDTANNLDARDHAPDLPDMYKSVGGFAEIAEDGVEVWNFDISKGDTPGHEFRGNQYTEGTGKLSSRADDVADRANDEGASKSIAAEHKSIAEGHKSIAMELADQAAEMPLTQANYPLVAKAGIDNFKAFLAHANAANAHEEAAKALANAWSESALDAEEAAQRTSDDAATASAEAHGATSIAANSVASQVAPTRAVGSSNIPGETFAEKAATLHADSISGGEHGDFNPDEEHENLAKDHAAIAANLRDRAGQITGSPEAKAAYLEGAAAHDKASAAHQQAALAAQLAIKTADRPEGEATQELWFDRSEEAAKASADAEKVAPTSTSGTTTQITSEARSNPSSVKYIKPVNLTAANTLRERAASLALETGRTVPNQAFVQEHTQIAKEHTKLAKANDKAGNSDIAEAHRDAAHAHEVAAAFTKDAIGVSPDGTDQKAIDAEQKSQEAFTASGEAARLERANIFPDTSSY